MLSQTTGYAISALGCIASSAGRFRLVKDVSACAGVSLPYLSKIVLTLSRKGVLSTQKGIGGGVQLARDPESISLFDVAVLMDDPIVQMRCMMGTAPCSDQRHCPCHEFWSAHRERTLAFLKGTTIAEIARFEAKRCEAVPQLQSGTLVENLDESLSPPRQRVRVSVPKKETKR